MMSLYFIIRFEIFSNYLHINSIDCYNDNISITQNLGGIT